MKDNEFNKGDTVIVIGDTVGISPGNGNTCGSNIGDVFKISKFESSAFKDILTWVHGVDCSGKHPGKHHCISIHLIRHHGISRFYDNLIKNKYAKTKK